MEENHLTLLKVRAVEMTTCWPWAWLADRWEAALFVDQQRSSMQAQIFAFSSAPHKHTHSPTRMLAVQEYHAANTAAIDVSHSACSVAVN